MMKTYKNQYIALLLTLITALSLLPWTVSLAKTNEAPLPEFTADDYVSLCELSEQALEGWHETYTAKERQVEVNVNIPWMPQVDECPIVQVEPFGSGDVDSEILALFRNYNLITESVGDSGIRISASDDSYFLVRGYKGLRVMPQDLDFYYGETPTEQPEQVDLDYPAFLGKINSDLAVFSEYTTDDFMIEKVEISGLSYKAKERNGETILGDPINKWGYYQLWAKQLFHGIPMINSLDDSPQGLLLYGYSSPTRFGIDLRASKEVALHTPDVPLLSFDAIKRTLENQIENGNLRGVDKMEFGYLATYQENGDNRSWLLIPVWRVEGGYTKDPNTDKPIMPYYNPRDTDGSQTVPQAYGDYYYSAQTGEMLPTPKLTQKSAAVPFGNLLMWNDVNGNR